MNASQLSFLEAADSNPYGWPKIPAANTPPIWLVIPLGDPLRFPSGKFHSPAEALYRTDAVYRFTRPGKPATIPLAYFGIRMRFPVRKQDGMPRVAVGEPFAGMAWGSGRSFIRPAPAYRSVTIFLHLTHPSDAIDYNTRSRVRNGCELPYLAPLLWAAASFFAYPSRRVLAPDTSFSWPPATRRRVQQVCAFTNGTALLHSARAADLAGLLTGLRPWGHFLNWMWRSPASRGTAACSIQAVLPVLVIYARLFRACC